MGATRTPRDIARRAAADIDARLEPSADATVTAETEATYRGMPYVSLVLLREAFTMDRDHAARLGLRAFCQSRIDLINRVLAERTAR